MIAFGAALAVVGSSAISAQVRYRPLMCVDVSQDAGAVDFAVYVKSRDGKIVPGSLDGLYVRRAADNVVIWEIESEDYSRASKVRYGVAPPGFTQQTPASGVAQPLVPGVKYLVDAVSVATGRASFVYQRVTPSAPCGLDETHG